MWSCSPYTSCDGALRGLSSAIHYPLGIRCHVPITPFEYRNVQISDQRQSKWSFFRLTRCPCCCCCRVWLSALPKIPVGISSCVGCWAIHHNICHHHHFDKYIILEAILSSTFNMRGRGAITIASQLFVCPGSAFHAAPGAICLGVPVPPRTSRVRALRRWRASAACRVTMRGDLDQDSTPLVDALAEAAGNVRSPMFYPGHKMGR